MLGFKFRIRRKEDGSLLPDNFPICIAADGRVIMESNAPIVYGGQHVGDAAFSDITGDVIVEWFTSIRDKNGAEIYEGDAVRCYGGEHCQGHWEFDRTVVITDITDYEVMALLCESEHIEVIGNIYKNPELRRLVNNAS